MARRSIATHPGGPKFNPGGFTNTLSTNAGRRGGRWAGQDTSNQTEARLMVNNLRSEFAQEMRVCAEEFEGLSPEHFMLTVYKQLDNLRRDQIKKDAGFTEIRNTIKEMRMAAADIMAFHAALDRNKKERSAGPDPMKDLLLLDDLGTDGDDAAADS